MTGRRQPPHDRAVLRSPLPPPSAAAKRFLPPDPAPFAYPANKYIQPSEALAKSAALAAAQREAELLREAAAREEMPTDLNTHIAPPRAPGGNHG